MLLAIISLMAEAAKAAPDNSHDIVEVLQLLVLPVVLVCLPILLKRNKRNSVNSKHVADQVGTTNGNGTLAAMAEKTLLAVGGLQADIKHMNDCLEAHAKQDEQYSASTDRRLDRIEKAVKS